jgi:hypothetical protein
MAIDTIVFKRDEIGADIALLEDTDWNAALLRNPASLAMYRPTIPEKKHYIDVEPFQYGLEECRPIFQRTPEDDGIARVEKTVATIEIYFEGFSSEGV